MLTYNLLDETNEHNVSDSLEPRKEEPPPLRVSEPLVKEDEKKAKKGTFSKARGGKEGGGWKFQRQ